MSRFIVPFLDFFQKATDAPLIYGEASALMALSTISLARRWVSIGEGVQANVYLMLAGDSSVARKSTSVNYAKKMLNFVEPQRIAPNDYTMEGLMKWMGETPDGEPKGSKKRQNHIGIFSDEFGADLSRMTAYGPTMQADFCKLYDGEDVQKVRVASSPLIVTKPRVSLFAGAAYQMLQAHLTAKDWTNGFLMRFLYVAPTPGQMRKKFSTQPLRPQLEWDIAQAGLTAILAELDQPRQFGPPGLPGLAPATRTWFGLPIDPAAQAKLDLLGAWFDQILPGLPFIMQVYTERFKTSVQKIALLFQIDEDSTVPIGVNAMDRAINFCGPTCWHSFQTTYEKTTSGEFSALTEMTRQLLLDKGGSMPIRELSRQFPNNRQVIKVVDFLIGTDLARRKKVIVAGAPVEVLELTS